MRARTRFLNLKSSIYLSLGLHAVLIFAAAFLFRQTRGFVLPSRTAWIELVPARPADKALDREKAEIDERGKRVVQTEKGTIVKNAAIDAFLGERTQTVDRETVSKDHSIAMGHEKPAAPKAPPQAAHPAAPEEAAKKTAEKMPEKIKDIGKLGLAILPTPKEMDEIIRKKTLEGDRPDWAAASPSANAPHDYVQGLKEGEQTALNTREFVFYGYYQRIRERLDRAWVPILRQRLQAHFLAGRRIASDMEHTTRVLVILNTAGEVVHVRVTSESGTTVIDDAAVAAFSLAGPFPNPPRDLVDRDGEIKIPWEFILKS